MFSKKKSFQIVWFIYVQKNKYIIISISYVYNKRGNRVWDVYIRKNNFL